ncbi:thioredoxin family protein [uncultured Nevskia sp.]|uniref:thioredoxin family protein n=1 Tax=uncultured Nevskia sp. TaxID=228950 RepID=UPI0026005AE2|nr:thioredoxin family protein [uncultured Nevskia sp.]
MALTPSTMLPLATLAPAFSLPDTVSGRSLSLAELQSDRATVVMFICNHCPYVIHIRDGLLKLAQDYIAQGVSFVAISSNDAANYPDDAPDKMAALAQREHFPFPYLYDESQTVARAYQAACTPDFFVFDGVMKLAYRGQLDDSRPGNGKPVTGVDLRAALDALLAGRAVGENQIPSVGCGIKWKRA